MAYTTTAAPTKMTNVNRVIPSLRIDALLEGLDTQVQTIGCG
jgi:hypothetical protein